MMSGISRQPTLRTGALSRLSAAFCCAAMSAMLVMAFLSLILFFGGRWMQILGAAGLRHLAGHVMADEARQRTRERDQPGEIEPGRNPHSLAHGGGILGRDIARGARRKRAAAEPAQGRVEAAGARAIG